jgi:hypothetical protein
MREPVLLPSGHVVDKTTIAQHLLNDETGLVLPDSDLCHFMSAFPIL